MLIYTSFPIMNQEGPPDWVAKLINNPLCSALGFKFYNPWEGLSSQIPHLTDKLTVKPNATAITNRDALKLDRMLFESITGPDSSKVLSRIAYGDSGPNMEVPFKDLYVLLRSDMILVDMCNPSFGGTSQEVLYGYLLDIPIVGITDRFINSPWILGKVKAVCSPKTSDDILRLILPFAEQSKLMFTGLSALRLANDSDKPKDPENP